MTGVLLDTCTIIWLAAHERLFEPGRSAILAAVETGDAAISPVSAWELGIIAGLRRSALQLSASPEAIFEAVLARPGVRVAPLGYRSAIRSATLPSSVHADPADRLLIATARDMGLTLITRDQRILDYAAAGHLKALRC